MKKQQRTGQLRRNAEVGEGRDVFFCFPPLPIITGGLDVYGGG